MKFFFRIFLTVNLKMLHCRTETAVEQIFGKIQTILFSSSIPPVSGRLSREEQTRRLLSSLSTGINLLTNINRGNISVVSRRTSAWWGLSTVLTGVWDFTTTWPRLTSWWAGCVGWPAPTLTSTSATSGSSRETRRYLPHELEALLSTWWLPSPRHLGPTLSILKSDLDSGAQESSKSTLSIKSSLIQMTPISYWMERRSRGLHGLEIALT